MDLKISRDGTFIPIRTRVIQSRVRSYGEGDKRYRAPAARAARAVNLFGETNGERGIKLFRTCCKRNKCWTIFSVECGSRYLWPKNNDY